MNTIISQIVNLENLYWAWEKVKFTYQPGEMLFDEIEIAQFEANLEEELESIRNQIESGKYRITPIRPIAFPKSVDPETKKPRVRQTFWISVRDQVTWLAVTNIIGPHFDYQMPFWSYGNRLYRCVFRKQNKISGEQELKFGFYRHTSKHTYRKWNQSWPLYRRYIAITARVMAWQSEFKNRPEDFKKELEDDKEREILIQNDSLPVELKTKYLEVNYWTKKLSGEIYWAGIDLKKFYPNINLKLIVENYKKYFPDRFKSTELESLLNNLLKFPVNNQEWTNAELQDMDLDPTKKYLPGIPTGLFAAGFLANLAFLEIDKTVTVELLKRRNIAHFRFVDDHVVLADNFDNLVKWVVWYENILIKYNKNLQLNQDKTEPAELKDLLGQLKDSQKSQLISKGFKGMRKKYPKLYSAAKKNTELDPKFLSPLMTQTLAKVSQMAQTEFELLDKEEGDKFIADVEHLLITEFPDQELRKDTRVSFAASVLSRIVPKKQIDITQLYATEESINKINEEIKKINEKNKSANQRKKQNLKEEKISLLEQLKELGVKRIEIQKVSDDEEDSLKKHTGDLLLKAIKEHHEKRKLWVRILQYYRLSGSEDLRPLLNLIDDLLGKNIINELSAEFIYAAILHVLSQLLIDSYHTINYRKSSYLEKKRVIKFLKGVTRKEFLNKILVKRNNPPKFYHQKSIDLFKFSLGSILYLVSSDKRYRKEVGQKEYLALVDKYNLINWPIDPVKFILRTKYPLACWSWWIIQKTSRSLSTEPNAIWFKTINLLSTDNPRDLSIIALYPKSISSKVFISLGRNSKINKYVSCEGWVYDLIQATKNKKICNVQIKNAQIYKVFKKIKEQEKDKSVYDWIVWSRNRLSKILEDISENEENFFDPRLSEWTALEIIIQIATAINSKIHNIQLTSINDLLLEEDSQYFKIHPVNYVIPRAWTEDCNELTWECWKSIVGKEKLNIRADSSLLISDFRYTPIITDPFNKINRELSVVNGLGVMLLGLLTRSFDFPPYWNPRGMQRAWIQLSGARLKESPVSSRTNLIISSCFSKRNRETVYSKIYQSDLTKVDDDTDLDPPEIASIQDFINNAVEAQKKLVQYQLTVQDHKARQLIPCSLIQLRKDCDLEQNIENE